MDIVPYNYLDSERLRFGRYPVLDTILYRWARRIEETLFEEARVEVYAGSSVVEEMKFSSFFTSLHHPRPIYFYSLEPFEGTGLFLVDNRFSTFCLRRQGRAMEGGRDTAGEIKLSPENQGRLQRVVQRLMDDFAVSWSGIYKVRPHLHKVTTYPFRARVLHPYELCLVAQIHLSGHNISSRLTWCFPRPMLEPVMERLQESKVLPPMGTEPRKRDRQSSAELLEHLRYGVQVRMGQIDLSATKGELKVGALVPLEFEYDGQAVVEVEGKPALVASIGQVEGRYAVKVDAAYSPPKNPSAITKKSFQPMEWPRAEEA